MEHFGGMVTKPLNTIVRVYPGQQTAYGVTLTRSHRNALVTLKQTPGFNVGAYTEINEYLYEWLVRGQQVEQPSLLMVEAVA